MKTSESRIISPNEGEATITSEPSTSPTRARQFVMSLVSAVLWPFLALMVLVVIWEAWVRMTTSNPLLLPTPRAVWDATIENWDVLSAALLTTLWESLLGFAIAIIAGLLFAALIVASRIAERTLLPALTVLNASPKIVVAPILVIWFGIGYSSKVWLAFLLSFFPIVVNCIRGFSDVDPALLEFWHLMRASERRIFRQVRVPNCLPYLYDGCLVALPIAFVGAVIGEFVGSDAGIGHVIIIAYSQFDTPTVFAATILVSIMSTILFLLLRSSERFIIRWGPSVQAEGESRSHEGL